MLYKVRRCFEFVARAGKHLESFKVSFLYKPYFAVSGSI